jgi:hypothetical protein
VVDVAEPDKRKSLADEKQKAAKAAFVRLSSAAFISNNYGIKN